MRPIQVLFSSLVPFLIGLLAIYLVLFGKSGANSIPFELFIIVTFYGFPTYCIFCLPFYLVVYYLQGLLKRSIFFITVIVLVYLQGFIYSFGLNVPLFSKEMLSAVFPLFAIMMLSFICCIFVFKKHSQQISRIN